MEVVGYLGLILRMFLPGGPWMANWIWPFLVIALLSFIAAWVLVHVIRRRRFYRRNSAGVEGFANYGHKMRSDAYEFMLTLIATALMIGSLVAVAASLVGYSYVFSG